MRKKIRLKKYIRKNVAWFNIDFGCGCIFRGFIFSKLKPSLCRQKVALTCLYMSLHCKHSHLSVWALPEKRRYCALLCIPWDNQHSINMAHSYSCSLIHATPLFSFFCLACPPALLPPFLALSCLPSPLLQMHSSISATSVASLRGHASCS